MTARPLPAPDGLVIGFAHAAYRLAERFALRSSGLAAVEARTGAELDRWIGDVDVLVVSGLWRNDLIPAARRLCFVQSISAGTDQYDRAQFRANGIRLASAQGANEKAVAQHAMALILALARKLPQARDNQTARVWRAMISEIAAREDELGGKTLVIVGMGRIGARLAQLAKAFEMRVVGVRRDPSAGRGAADRVVADTELHQALGEADYVALTCPLTPQTERLIDARALAAMPRHAVLINVARGRVVDQPALIAALEAGTIAGAAIDCAVEEPLPPSSPLWTAPNLLITPHTAGETRRYEDHVIDLLLENLARLGSGGSGLKNEIV